jgi:hypothetical protein
VLDLVNPVLALRRLIDRGSKLGRDKAKARNAGHGSYLESLSISRKRFEVDRTCARIADWTRRPPPLSLGQHAGQGKGGKSGEGFCELSLCQDTGLSNVGGVHLDPLAVDQPGRSLWPWT